MTTVTHSMPDVDAPAAVQLHIDAQRAGLDAHSRITRETGGPTAIRFDSRDVFLAWVAFGLVHADPNPYHTGVDFDAHEVHVPVTFGWPYAWNAVAIYPTQDACTCDAELVHQAGCPADDIKVVVLDVSRAEGCSYCGGTTTNHLPACEFYLPRRIPGATFDTEPAPVAFSDAQREQAEAFRAAVCGE